MHKARCTPVQPIAFLIEYRWNQLHLLVEVVQFHLGVGQRLNIIFDFLICVPWWLFQFKAVLCFVHSTAHLYILLAAVVQT